MKQNLFKTTFAILLLVCSAIYSNNYCMAEFNINMEKTMQEHEQKKENRISLVQDIVQRKDSSVYRPIQIIRDGNNYGLTETSIDKKLQFLLEPQYQDIQPLNEYDVFGQVGCNYFKVMKNNKWGIYSLDKNAFISNFEYDKIENILKYHSHWYKLKVKVNKNNKWAILTNENISDFIYDDILKIDYYNDDILKVRINNKWGLYSCGDYFASNYEYKEISEIIYDDIVYEKSEQIGINDYEIHQLRGLKNGSWVILNKTKYVHKTAGSKVFDKLFGNFLRDFGK